MQIIVLCLAVIFTSTSIAHVDVNYLCGDNTWTTFEDEKCLKLFQTFETRDRAEDVCNRQGSTLVTIKSAAEQKFLNYLVFKLPEFNRIWIGAIRRPVNNTEFEWNDGSRVQRFTNWAIGRPSDNLQRTCVNLVPSILLGSLSEMEWFDTICTSSLWFICEKLQNWPHDHFQQAILATRLELQHSVEDFTVTMTNVRNQLKEVQDSNEEFTTAMANARNQLKELQHSNEEFTVAMANARKQLSELQDNPIPIGFIYVQLPNQPEPRNIWRTVQWVEITEEYAGLFFRVSGGGSEAFGTIQEEHSPRLRSVDFRLSTILADSPIDMPVTGAWSPWISTGANVVSGSHRRLRFIATAGEVRPRNHAVRIWRRAA